MKKQNQQNNMQKNDFQDIDNAKKIHGNNSVSSNFTTLTKASKIRPSIAKIQSVENENPISSNSAQSNPNYNDCVSLDDDLLNKMAQAYAIALKRFGHQTNNNFENNTETTNEKIYRRDRGFFENNTRTPPEPIPPLTERDFPRENIPRNRQSRIVTPVQSHLDFLEKRLAPGVTMEDYYNNLLNFSTNELLIEIIRQLNTVIFALERSRRVRLS